MKRKNGKDASTAKCATEAGGSASTAEVSSDSSDNNNNATGGDSRHVTSKELQVNKFPKYIREKGSNIENKQMCTSPEI